MSRLCLVCSAVSALLGAVSTGRSAESGDAVVPGSAAWGMKVEAVFPAEAGLADPSYGAESNPTGEPIGGGAGYSRLVAPAEATVTVSTGEGLVEALKVAVVGAIIYVADDAQVDLTAYQDITIPGGVTLAGGRGRDGGEGGLIFTKTVKSGRLFRTGGAKIRLTGLRFEGSHPGRERLTQRPIFLGIYHPDVEVDNCEIFAWSCAAVGVGSGATEGAWVHHNYIHHNQRAGLGYGVSLGRVHVLIEGNLFDFCRHAIASSGVPGSGYTARYNVHLENTISHVFDMHGARDFEKYKQVGLWHLDDGDGARADDTSIYNGNHDGRLVNGGDGSWVEGRIGKALRLDGRDDYMDFGKRRELSPVKGLTVSAWINMETTEGTHAILSKADTGAMGSGYSLRVVNGELEGALYRTDGVRVAVSAGGVRAGQWLHVAMTWDRRDIALYVAGERVAAGPCEGRKTSPNHLVLGRDSATATSFYRGAVDEVRVYNVAMKPDDIRRHAAGHCDISGGLILMHHNTIRATSHAALTVRGRPSIGCWVAKNRFYAAENTSVIRQVNATGNFQVTDNQYLGRGLEAAPDFTQAPLFGHWSFDRHEGSVVRDVSGRGRDAAVRGKGGVEHAQTESEEGALLLRGEERWLEVPKASDGQLPERVAIGFRMRVDKLGEHQVLLDNGLFRFFHRGAWAGARLYFLCRVQGEERGGDSSWSYMAGVRTQRGIREGEWFEVVGVREGPVMRIYLDGMLERELACLATYAPATARRGPLQVGANVNGALDDLWIRSAPEPTKAPELAQQDTPVLVSAGEPDQVATYVTPTSGNDATVFHFRVLYRDPKGQAPAIGFPRLHILRDGRRYVNEAPVTMLAGDTKPFEQGRVYVYSMRLPRGSAYAHFFEVETADGRVAATSRFDGPNVLEGSTAPVLSWTSQRGFARDGVEPEIGDVSMEFDFRVLFTDLDGDLPMEGHPLVHVRKAGTDIAGSPFVMAPMKDLPTWSGCPYRVRLRLAAGEDYSYYFTAKDASGNEAPQSLTRRSPIVDAGQDVAAPDLSLIGVEDVGTDSVVVVWKTDEMATSTVEFGGDATYGAKVESVELTETHRVRLEELKPAATYHYRVGSTDAASNHAQSGDYTFRTVAE